MPSSTMERANVVQLAVGQRCNPCCFELPNGPISPSSVSSNFNGLASSIETALAAFESLGAYQHHGKG